MKILLLSRPVINAGDFLFTSRARELLNYLLPNDDIKQHHLQEEMEYNYVSSFDVIVIAGGPIFDNRFLRSGSIPFFAFLRYIKKPIHFLGGGWYGKNTDIKTIFNYRFDKEVIENLKYIEKNGGSFSCRDYITETVLRNNGLNEVYMVGCTAWYNKEKINELYMKKIDFSYMKKIVISDQGLTKDSRWHDIKFIQNKNFIKAIKQLFPRAEISFTFNGGIKTKYSFELNEKMCKFLSKEGIRYYDISSSKKGFYRYDDVDLHIGYRVHSHIYALSQRIPTILIEEDARGGGLNQALGLPSIKNYLVNDDNLFVDNPYMIKELVDYMTELSREKCSRLNNAVSRMQDVYYRVTVPYIIKKIAGL